MRWAFCRAGVRSGRDAGLFLFKRRDAGLARLEIEHMGDVDTRDAPVKELRYELGTVTMAAKASRNSSGVGARAS